MLSGFEDGSDSCLITSLLCSHLRTRAEGVQKIVPIVTTRIHPVVIVAAVHPLKENHYTSSGNMAYRLYPPPLTVENTLAGQVGSLRTLFILLEYILGSSTKLHTPQISIQTRSPLQPTEFREIQSDSRKTTSNLKTIEKDIKEHIDNLSPNRKASETHTILLYTAYVFSAILFHEYFSFAYFAICLRFLSKFLNKSL